MARPVVERRETTDCNFVENENDDNNAVEDLNESLFFDGSSSDDSENPNYEGKSETDAATQSEMLIDVNVESQENDADEATVQPLLHSNVDESQAIGVEEATQSGMLIDDNVESQENGNEFETETTVQPEILIDANVEESQAIGVEEGGTETAAPLAEVWYDDNMEIGAEVTIETEPELGKENHQSFIQYYRNNKHIVKNTPRKGTSSFMHYLREQRKN